MTKSKPLVAVVVPVFRCLDHIDGVLKSIPSLCSRIYVVDDACPEKTGEHVLKYTKDPRVQVIKHKENQGVGGAIVSGYKKALKDNYDIVVKIDGDGQMDGALLPNFVAPILEKRADYTKGNRFHTLYSVRSMPKMRLVGNAVLSFMTKLSSGYWRIFDPTNGYTAIHVAALKQLELDKLSKRYFFETDMLIHLSDIRAVVSDVRMEALYGDEESGLKIRSVTVQFLWRHIRATLRRLFYGYFLRDFNLASANLMLGTILFSFGGLFGGYQWYKSASSGMIASTGTVMLAVLPLILGMQFILFFLSLDIASEPTNPIQKDVSFDDGN